MMSPKESDELLSAELSLQADGTLDVHRPSMELYSECTQRDPGLTFTSRSLAIVWQDNENNVRDNISFSATLK